MAIASAVQLWLHNIILRRLCVLLLWAGSGMLFVMASHQLDAVPRQPPISSGEMMVALPPIVQVFMSAGDRHLAADIGVIRALVVSTENKTEERFAVQAIAHRDIAWLNPYHEDNYYLATATLAWNGQLAASNVVLQKAIEKRTFDMLPPFLLGFNHYYFRKDVVEGVRWLNVSAQRADNDQSRISLQKMAARWLEKGQDLQNAVHILDAMAKTTRHSSLKIELNQRAERFRRLIGLRAAAARYQAVTGHPLANLQQLVSSGILPALPEDPLGSGFRLDSSGIPQFQDPPKK